MVMSQGTYTFLACFAGFWLVWALIVMLCCFCSFVQRRLKHRREARLRDHCLRTLETEPPHFCPPHTLPPHPPAPLTLPPSAWTSTQESDAFGKPPCYEEAVLMEDPPPPYSEVLADPRGGTFTKPASGTSRKPQDSKTCKTGSEAGLPEAGLTERPFSSLIRLPVDEHWDSLGRLLSTMDLNRNNLPPGDAPGLAPALASLPRRSRTNSELGLAQLQLEHTCALPTAFPLFGRSTAV